MEQAAKPEEDMLSHFIFVEPEEEIDEEAHAHGTAACSCALRGT